MACAGSVRLLRESAQRESRSGESEAKVGGVGEDREEDQRGTG